MFDLPRPNKLRGAACKELLRIPILVNREHVGVLLGNKTSAQQRYRQKYTTAKEKKAKIRSTGWHSTFIDFSFNRDLLYPRSRARSSFISSVFYDSILAARVLLLLLLLLYHR